MPKMRARVRKTRPLVSAARRAVTLMALVSAKEQDSGLAWKVFCFCVFPADHSHQPLTTSLVRTFTEAPSDWFFPLVSMALLVANAQYGGSVAGMTSALAG